MKYLGKISFSAMQGIISILNLGTPLLILMSDSGCKFIQLVKLKSISDEIIVQKPCQFKLNFIDHSLSFACFSSADYTEWITALLNCHEKILMPFQNVINSYSCSEIDQQDDESIREDLEVVRIASHLTFST